MENKINIAELLKDCPKGMPLDCTMYDNCTFKSIEDLGYIDILVNTPSGIIRLTKEGCYIRHDDNAKCVIFPKGKTTWEGFVPPCQFKDGDVIATVSGSVFILKTTPIDTFGYNCYVALNSVKGFTTAAKNFAYKGKCRLATEEEKEKLFQVIKDNGYKWNSETKTLEKLIEPKFKVGDKIQWKEDIREKRIIDNVFNDYYTVQGFGVILFTAQDEWELVPNKFDILKLKPFDKVLVRDFDNETWEINFFSKLLDGKHFKCLDSSYVQCIPYEGNEHLHDTTINCYKFYRTWENE